MGMSSHWTAVIWEAYRVRLGSAFEIQVMVCTSGSSSAPHAFADMDLCCLIDSDERLPAADLVTMLGDLLERGRSQ